jgi:hypothetical protein
MDEQTTLLDPLEDERDDLAPILGRWDDDALAHLVVVGLVTSEQARRYRRDRQRQA